MPDTDFRYKVRARYGQDWRQFDTVRMEISVGEEQHEGKKLQAAFDWAFTHFKHIVVLIADTQQRFDLMFEGASEQEAFQKALKAGDLWLQRNLEIISRPKTTIARWEDIKQKPDWPALYEKIRNLYKSDDVFSSKVNEGINVHWERQQQPKERFEEYCFFSRMYAIEEIAVLSMAYEIYGGISAYPGTLDFSKAMYESQAIINAPNGFHEANFTSLCFERRLVA